jgi:DNA-binding NarL/FixJ family response regulator
LTANTVALKPLFSEPERSVSLSSVLSNRCLLKAWRERLTAREQEAAILLAQGASNKEIARRMEITERTVKAHVGAMLEKLGARDRLQLSLIINEVQRTAI